jgi:hypothetical protein
MSSDEKEQLLVDKDVAVESVEDVQNQEEVCENSMDLYHAAGECYAPTALMQSVLLFVGRRNR